MLNQQIYQMLRDIAKQAYPDVKHNRFFVKIENKELRSKHGEWTAPWNGQISTIRVFNLSRGTQGILKTSIHELAHNTEYSIYRDTGHSKRFYAVYKRLLEAAIEMNLININEIKDIHDLKMLVKHHGPVRAKADPEKAYKQDKVIVKVKKSFNIKDRLQKMGYGYDGTQKCWSIEVPKDQLEEHLSELEGMTEKENVVVADFSNMKIEASCYVIISGNTYPIKDSLHDKGYIFNGYHFKTNVWAKKIPSQSKKAELLNLMFLKNHRDVKVKVVTA